MKRLILLVVSFWLLALGIEAAPALRGPFTVKQADGTLLTIEQFGDEYHHWTSMTDGTLVLNTTKGYCVAEIDEQGNLLVTDVLAHEPAQRSSKEQAVVSRQSSRRMLFHEQGDQARRRALHIGSSSSPYLPSSDRVRVLTILAAFQDLGFIVNSPVEAFDQYLNGDRQVDMGNGNEMNIASVRQYFETCSQGKFSPQFDVVGPVTLPQKMSFYGGSQKNGSDDRFTEFCQDAMEQAKSLVSDWSLYDNDKDGKVELVCVIFAGYGENQGGADSTIWAKAAVKNLKVTDQYRITRFNCSPELFGPVKGTDSQGRPYDYSKSINGTGVFIHEFSHCMGLPDLYATNKSGYVNNQGMESWSIMDYGLYGNNGFAPSPYTAWEQEVMGWTEIEEVSVEELKKGKLIADLLPLIDGGKAYKVANSDNDRDFIVMENMQKRGLYQYARGHGLLVYHIDYPNTVVNMYDSPNNNPGHPSVAVVPADSLMISSYLRGKEYTQKQWLDNMAACPFPGTKNVTTLTDRMQLPNYCFWNGNSKKTTGFALSGINEVSESGTISFMLAADEQTGINLINSSPKVEGTIYDLLGCRVVNPTRGIYIMQGKKVIVK